MSMEMVDKQEMFSRKIGLLFKFRNYLVKDEVEGKTSKDIVVVKRGEKGKILTRIVYSTPLVSGKVGVHYVRKMRQKIEKDGYKSGILIGQGFSYSAKKEAKSNHIETIEEKRIPTFNIFDHYLVPKHEVLPKEEAEGLLKKYHVEPHNLPQIRASDPAVFLIGARPGDIIKITRESPTAGVHTTYRHVV